MNSQKPELWAYLVIGVAVSLFGAFMVAVGAGNDLPAASVLGWVFSALGAMVVAVWVVAFGVSLGVRHGGNISHPGR